MNWIRYNCKAATNQFACTKKTFFFCIIAGVCVAMIVLMSTQRLMNKTFSPAWNKSTEAKSQLIQMHTKGKDKCNDVVIVTGYLNIGSFFKGSRTNVFSNRTYMNWMTAYATIQNDVVAYFDDIKMLEYFKKFARSPNIVSKLVNRTSLWSFGLRDKIDKVFKQPHYPKILPNTVIPEYSCAMHAKYDFLEMTIRIYSDDKYFMWVDMGYFRDLVGSRNKFGLSLPEGFDSSKVSYSEVFGFNQNISFRNIVGGDHVWVAGGAVLATRDVMLRFIRQYRHFVEICLSTKLMSTDQQILYGMFVNSGRKYKPKIEIQGHHGGWFHLGNICRQAWNQNQCKR